MKQAVCYKKSASKICKRAKAVARLLITRQYQNQDKLRTATTASLVTFSIHSSRNESLFPTGPLCSNVEYFRTGWLVGRSNHLMTNYLCIGDLLAASADRITFNQ